MKKKQAKIVIASDHAGLQLKTELAAWMQQSGYALEDAGTHLEDSVDYPDYAHLVAGHVEKKTFDYGILICGTGIGMDITANKHSTIRSALCWNPQVAALARSHNNANIICLPGRFIDLETAGQIISAFFSTEFTGGRHRRRLEKISC